MMISTGKCPYCDKVLQDVTLEHIMIKKDFEPKWHGASLVCPWCRKILNVSLDPVALKNDLVDEMLKHLKKSK
ncbi:MAG: hypothetical protein L0Z46_02720 [Nitrospiraceae bacterium]|nr:hypothetical protein [Nitrospiraceae bacterium]